YWYEATTIPPIVSPKGGFLIAASSASSRDCRSGQHPCAGGGTSARRSSRLTRSSSVRPPSARAYPVHAAVAATATAAVTVSFHQVVIVMPLSSSLVSTSRLPSRREAAQRPQQAWCHAECVRSPRARIVGAC